MKKSSISPEAALVRLQTLCAASEQCSSELRNKLHRWGLPASTAEKILQSLVNDKFVDDERFARAFVRHSYRFSRWGRAKIAAALSHKQIQRNLISTALQEEIDEDEYTSIASSLIHSRAAIYEQPLSFDDRRRLFRFMFSRGFETALVSRLIKDLDRG